MGKASVQIRRSFSIQKLEGQVGLLGWWGKKARPLHNTKACVDSTRNE